MEMYYNLIAVALVSLVIIGLIIAMAVMKRKMKNLNAELAQAILDQVAYMTRISELLNEKESMKLEATDGFVKFLSESRDWAFEYIEDVQQSIQSLQDAIQSGYPTEEEMEKLFSFLPNNKENNE